MKAPDGFRYVWVEDSRWRLIPADRKRTCAMKGCGYVALVEFNRGQHRDGIGTIDSWWAYCGRHLYGRRIRNGKIESRRLVEAVA